MSIQVYGWECETAYSSSEGNVHFEMRRGDDQWSFSRHFSREQRPYNTYSPLLKLFPLPTKLRIYLY